ncbi:thioredoxin peroxidase [Rozella allomycis CSF55]|uniref:thioredoxin-dependent peroxiredoxin n=1 Tax=Rozella allomycis (strain CSF55) TaxID=988480 RepID=A0A075APT7_ROZAC|nr:Peroxiredoxin-1 [Rozella allomycis CSF55]RKP21173.1 thioredoxin peroxidase [Rozella allomycis CSF55]|eukprot:EPZ32226.1 Peroxiredoxin-1 [Rozella allomycis CSF55]
MCMIQQKAPQWKTNALVNGEIKELSSEKLHGKYHVLFFYPLDFTFVCPTEIIAFNDRFEEFKKLDCNLIAASVDSVYSHLAWTNMPRNQGGLGEMKIPILSDLNKSISKSYGVLINDAVAVRALFVIDGKGTIRHITMNDLPIGRNVDEALRVVQALQYTDEHGEVCPVNWKKGDNAMKPDPKKSKEYFEENYPK